MLSFDTTTNLLMQSKYRYNLQDVAEPNLYREIYDYDHVPKVAFNLRHVPMQMPDEIWMTDTTFRAAERQPLHPGADPAPVQADEPTGRPQGHGTPERILPLYGERPESPAPVPGSRTEIPGDHHLDPGQ